MSACGLKIPVYSLNTLVIGSGAAGLNCALHLVMDGQRDVAVVTEDLMGGTSRNAGSDKQTYYKVSLSGDQADSPYDLACTLFEGGAMHGDIALVEASLSAQEFHHLVLLGVPFPHDRYGSYVGYKTDNDPKQRGTSAGPMTSWWMHERLLSAVEAAEIEVLDGHEAVSLFRHDDRVVGALCVEKGKEASPNHGLAAFNARNVVLATGGPGSLYKASVYPESHHGGLGIAINVGARFRNLTEWQYGMASVKFRWNVSGSYQQVIPRYISTDQEGGDEREFLNDFFPSTSALAGLIFLKGYQWPFDVRKVPDHGSSLIDILVHRETVSLGRRVFLDYTRDLKGLRLEGLDATARDYLERSGAVRATPIRRLRRLNPPAIEVYADHGIHLAREPLEIAVCAQHNNGGLAANIWWESNVRHLFPIGEASGSHGVYRPGGAALNSGQVGGYRAAQYIAKRYSDPPLPLDEFADLVRPDLEEEIRMVERVARPGHKGQPTPDQVEWNVQERMTRYAAHVRSRDGVERALEGAYELARRVEEGVSARHGVARALRAMTLVRTHIVYLEAMREYLAAGGGSRGSFLVLDSDGSLPIDGLEEEWRCLPFDRRMFDRVCEVWLEDGTVAHEWVQVNPIPADVPWFETVWDDYLQDRVV